jgi:uncharacterized protein YggE
MRYRLAGVLVVCVLALAATARADDATVSAEGTSTLQKAPTMVRVVYEITATGKDTKEAMDKLTQERNDLKTKVAALKPVEGSLKIGDPSIGTGSSLSERQQQIQQMMDMNRGGKKGPVKPSVTVSATLKAAFALPAGSADDLLVASKELEDKIKGVLNKGVVAKPATPEEQEEQEENAGAQEQFPGMAKPGEPQFIYVFPVSDDEAAKVTADALGKAKAQATLLATAVGAKLGAVEQLSASSMVGRENPYEQNFDEIAQAMSPTPEEGVREAMGSQPGAVRYTATVSAKFKLQQ